MTTLALRCQNLLATTANGLNHFTNILPKKALELDALFMAGVAPPSLQFPLFPSYHHLTYDSGILLLHRDSSKIKRP